MEKQQLVAELRSAMLYRVRQKRRNEIIDTYTLCPNCGEHYIIKETQILQAIDLANSGAHFLNLIEKFEALNEPTALN